MDKNFNFPCYQLKIAGFVIENFNSLSQAIQIARGSATNPIEIFEVRSNGSARLAWGQSWQQ